MPAVTGVLFKLVMGGPLADGEQWACSIHLMNANPGSTQVDLALAMIDTPVLAWFDRSESATNPSARLGFIKLNQIIKSTGLYTDGNAAHTIFIDPVHVPGAPAGSTPPELTSAITWHTDLARGKGSKGRIYPPNGFSPGGVAHLDQNGYLDDIRALALAQSARTLLQDLNELEAGLQCVVWSHVGQFGQKIERVSCGKVIDVQKRRRNRLNEQRIFAAGVAL